MQHEEELCEPTVRLENFWVKLQFTYIGGTIIPLDAQDKFWDSSQIHSFTTSQSIAFTEFLQNKPCMPLPSSPNLDGSDNS